MLGTILLINLAGAVALLLWGTHMVSSGVLRGFGTALRNWLAATWATAGWPCSPGSASPACCRAAPPPV